MWILKVMKPARKVVTRSPHREVGYLAGASVGEAEVEHESHLEKSFAVLAVVSGVVRGLESQPFKIIWTDPNGSEHLYTPDYRVTLTDGTEVIVELKPARFIDKHRVLFDEAAKQLRAADVPFFVLTDEHLQREHGDIAQLWRRYRHSQLPEHEVAQALALAHQGITLGDIERSPVPRYVWYGLLGRGLVGIEQSTLMSEPSTRLLTSQELAEYDCRIRFIRWFGCSPWRPLV